jgi:hypothetical protein
MATAQCSDCCENEPSAPASKPDFEKGFYFNAKGCCSTSILVAQNQPDGISKPTQFKSNPKGITVTAIIFSDCAASLQRTHNFSAENYFVPPDKSGRKIILNSQRLII